MSSLHSETASFGSSVGRAAQVLEISSCCPLRHFKIRPPSASTPAQNSGMSCLHGESVFTPAGATDAAGAAAGAGAWAFTYRPFGLTQRIRAAYPPPFRVRLEG
jgi:hypothetical protein